MNLALTTLLRASIYSGRLLTDEMERGKTANSIRKLAGARYSTVRTNATCGTPQYLPNCVVS